MVKQRSGPVMLTQQQRAEILQLMNSDAGGLKFRKRLMIIIMSADGSSDSDIASTLGTCAHTINRWRDRFIVDGTSGLTGLSRPGRLRHVNEQKVVQLLNRARSTQLEMTIRRLAKKGHVSPTTICRVAARHGIMLNKCVSKDLSRLAGRFDNRHINLYQSSRVKILVIATGGKTSRLRETSNASHEVQEVEVDDFDFRSRPGMKIDARYDNRTLQEESLIVKRLLQAVEDAVSLHATFTVLMFNINGPLHKVVNEWTSNRQNWETFVATSNKAWTQWVKERLEIMD